MSPGVPSGGRAARRCHRRRRSIRSIAGTGLLLLLGCTTAPPSRPDVILITLDTTRADHLGVYGYARDITPEIDRFAGDAVVYRRAWSTASWTLPAHASMLTGKQPTSHGAHFNVTAGDTTLGQALRGPIYRKVRVTRLGEQEITLAELLSDAGYETAAFAGGPWLAPVFGLLQGYAHQDAEPAGAGGRPADELTDRAVAWIDDVPADRPLHLLVNYFDPHAPYAPPPGYDDLPRARAPVTASVVDVNRGAALAPLERAVMVDRYDGEIRFMDHHVGRLLAALRAAGRYDRSLIVVVADHGETFGEHGLMEHGRWLYEEVLRVPLLVHYPQGREAGAVLDVPVSVVDLFSLVLREAGLTPPAAGHGVPIGRRGLVLAEAFRDALAIEVYGPRFDRDLVAGVRWPWKLVLSDTGATELYRLDEDPGELRDLADGRVEADLRRTVEAARAALVPARDAEPPGQISPEVREGLRALGYIR